MLAHKSPAIAPPDPEEKVRVKAISRPAVALAALTLTAALLVSILVTSPEGGRAAGAAAGAAAPPEGGTPAFLERPPGEDPDLAGRLAALRGGGEGGSDSVGLARALLERLAGEGGREGTRGAPGGLPGLTEEERRYYAAQLERRSALAATGSAAADPAREAYLAGLASSPIVFNGGYRDRASGGAGAAGASGGWLAAARQVAAARGDGEMADALGALAEAAASDGVQGDARYGEEAGYGAGHGAPAPAPRRHRATLEAPLSPFEIKEGTLIPALLETAISSDLAGGVRARITRDVFDSRTQRHLLIPKGSTLIGSSEGAAAVGRNRLAVAWERVILPDGRSLPLAAWETKDGEGAGGVRAGVDRHLLRVFSGAMMVSLIGAGVQVATYGQGGGAGYGYGASRGHLVGGAVAAEFGEVSAELLRRSLDARPTVTLPAGQPFHVFARADLAFDRPYAPSDGVLADW